MMSKDEIVIRKENSNLVKENIHLILQFWSTEITFGNYLNLNFVSNNIKKNMNKQNNSNTKKIEIIQNEEEEEEEEIAGAASAAFIDNNQWLKLSATDKTNIERAKASVLFNKSLISLISRIYFLFAAQKGIY